MDREATIKIIAYCPLHYGREYLAYSIRSVIDAIDELHILYTAQGSHGSRTPIPCPETRDELYAITSKAAGNKLRWHDGDWYDEGSQRMTVHKVAPDADIILALDSDEVWDTRIIEPAIQQAVETSARIWRVPMIHYWRSFYRAIINDHAYPVRIIYQNGNPDQEAVMDFKVWDTPGTAAVTRYINHFGYAQTPAIVDYKWQIHGHKSEYRRDIDWFKDRYLANAQSDCHPVSVNHWYPQAVNPLDYMPAFMQSHPYFNCEVIE